MWSLQLSEINNIMYAVKTLYWQANTRIQLTTLMLLHKPCKRFAGVARVCQRQLAFLVFKSM